MKHTLFKHSFRLFRKNKLFSAINILGLSLSLALSLLLFSFVFTEKSVDNFHKNSDRIYRLTRAEECAFSPPFGQYIVDNIDEAEAFCRTFILEGTFKSDYNLLKSPNCYYADSNFFEMFSFPLLQGESQKVLASRNNVVLSQSFAERLFPNDNPIGKTIRFNNRLDYVVSGIVRDFDAHTHFQKADVIFPFTALADFFGNEYYLSQYDMRYFLPSLYVLVKKDSNLSNKGEELYNKTRSWYWLFQEDESNNVKFQPLSEAYLNPVEYGFPLGARDGNKQLLKFLTHIVFGILFIAIINFVNLTITYSIKRRNEIGIKKVIGAHKHQIISQSVLETLFLIIPSSVLALIFTKLALPYYNQITEHQATLAHIFTFIPNKTIITTLISLFFISALIPALITSGISPSVVVQKHFIKLKLNTIQQSMVVVQFTISIMLIISMVTIQKQNHFLLNYNVGFNKEETLYIELNSEIKNKKLQFKEELGKIAGVQNVSLCNGMPGVGIPELRFEANNKTQDIDFLNVDEAYFDVMGISLSKPVLPDNNNCWINESAARSLGYEPEDKTIEIEEYGVKRTYWVNEILPDMNFHPLYKKARPAIFTKINTDIWVDYALLRVNSSNIQQILKNAEKIHNQFAPNFPFDFAFLNNEVNKVYEREMRTSKIILWFSTFAILISAMGLFALSVISINKRIKEIGVRKVNGARVSELLAMLNKDFISWIIIAFVIAAPLAWFVMNKWLQNFAYKTEISWWIFALAGIISLVIALITVSWQSWRAARRNPVEALRYE